MADTTGPEDAKYALVSRSPGKYDVEAGYPFAGPSGRVVDALLQQNNLHRDDIILTNVVLCKTDKPSKEAIACCSKRLENDLDGVETILAGGAEAVRAILGGTLSQRRGIHHVINYAGRDRTCVATYNPAYALRQATVFPSLRDDFRRSSRPAQTFTAPAVEVTEDLEQAEAWLKELLTYERLAIDIETTGLSAKDKLVSIGFAQGGERAYVLGVQVCGGGEWHETSPVTSYRGQQLLREFFASYDGDQLYHNGQFDTKILREAGIEARVTEDTQLLSYSCDERGIEHHKLEYLLQNELEWPDYESEDIKVGKKNGFRFDRYGLPFSQWDDLYTYNGFDCCGSYQLFPIFRARADKDDTLGRYHDVLIPASNALAQIERVGIRFNKAKASQISEEEVKPRLAQMNMHALDITGMPINLNSHKQCGVWLYDVMKVRDPKLNQHGDEVKVKSVDEKHRDWIRAHVTNTVVLSFVDTLHEFKKLDKLRGTYLDGLISRVDKDGRIRCDLLLPGTETSRLSSRNPNLQNQPRTTDADIERGEGYINIRQLYMADPNGIIVSADYSQLELRTAAVLANEDFLLSVYAEGKDLHDEMATFLFGKSFTSEQRVAAKGANFGCLFGIQGWYFGRLFGMSTEEGQRVVDRWWARVPSLAKWRDDTQAFGRAKGYVRTAFGHKRRFPLITNENRDHVLREMVNTPVQGTASDFTTCSLIDLDTELPDFSDHVVLAVHDATVSLCQRKNQKVVCDTIKEVMEAQPKLRLGWDQIPFTVDIKTGPDWGHVK